MRILKIMYVRGLDGKMYGYIYDQDVTRKPLNIPIIAFRRDIEQDEEGSIKILGEIYEDN